MWLYKKIEFNTEREAVKQYRIFNVPVLEVYIRNLQSKKLHYSILPFFKKDRSYFENPVNKHTFYLKVNNINNTSFQCIQHWINIIGWLKADFYIICDNDILENMIYNRIRFNNKNIKFIKSAYKPLTNIVKNISTPFWSKATYAHLTAFLHAKKHKIQNFWDIDADDTMFLVEAPRAAEIIRKAAEYADKNNLDAFSMDMHTSRTHGKHWSFGITYIRPAKDWFSILNNNKNTDWMGNYFGKYDYEFNLDWFFTYLRDFKNLNAKTFYIENLHFMHSGDFMLNPISWHISHWKKGKVHYPILKYVFNNSDLSEIPVSRCSIKIDTIESEDKCFDYINRYLSFLAAIPEPAKNMWFTD